MKKKSHLLFWVIFPLGWTLLSALLIFYFDLANGPLVFFVLELVLLVAFFIARVLVRNRKLLMRLITWACFITLTITMIALSQPTAARKSAAYYSHPEKISEVLELNEGKVQGFYSQDKKVKVYAGIPYAQAERWKEPQEYKWENTLDGTYFGPRSMQPDSSAVTSTLVDIYSEKGWHPNYQMKPLQEKSEDSLYLNIWRPNNDETNLPILVYIHGGSLTTGASSYEDYNGESMAKTGVIMITIQYRLNIFGYFAHPDLKNESLAETGHGTTGNYGLLDQIYALGWINRNAANFGGDKNNITVAGESAGSSSVSAICASPLAKGLFKRAIGESSSLVIKKAPHTYRTEEKAYETSEKILKEFKCNSVDELRKVKADKLVNTKYKNAEMMLDGYALTKDPYQVYLDKENNEEALLNGYNVKEADAFVVPTYLLSPTNKSNAKGRLVKTFGKEYGTKIYDLYKDKLDKDAFNAFNEIFSVYWFIMPHHSWSNIALNNDVSVYRYQFTKENGFHSTYHSGEMAYCYGNLKRQNKSFAYDESDYQLEKTMLTYWSNFAKSGNPNGSGVPEWKPYTADGEVMELGNKLGPIVDQYQGLYDVINQFIDSGIDPSKE